MSTSYALRRRPFRRRRLRRGARLALTALAVLLLLGCYRLGALLPRNSLPSALQSQLSQAQQEQLAYIQAHPELYFQELAALAQSRPEAIDFVYNYPTQARAVAQNAALTAEELQAAVPALYQWDSRWGYAEYGDNLLALNGCGPTCLSMVVTALTDTTDALPSAIAAYSAQNGYYIPGTGTSWDLMAAVAQQYGLQCTQPAAQADALEAELAAGHLVLCSMRPGHFTTSGHFILLVGMENGKLLVHDPNSMTNTATLWEMDTVLAECKGLWSFSK